MEAATKNKRGRPKTIARKIAEETRGSSNKGTRAQVNEVYRSIPMLYITEEQKAFFHTNRGRPRRTGILEQIGRLYDADLIDKEEIPELTQLCIGFYLQGYTVKQIEKILRNHRRRKMQEGSM